MSRYILNLKFFTYSHIRLKTKILKIIRYITDNILNFELLLF